MLVLSSALGCCGAFQSQGDKYKKEMECASRLTDQKSIEILQKGMFCCESVPKEIQDLPEARRFYLLRASALDPSAAEPFEGIAKSYWDDGNYREALKAFEEVRKRTPKPVAAVIGEVTMYRLLSESAPAFELTKWLRVTKGIDGEKVADYLEGRLYYDGGKYEAAEPLLKDALQRAEKGNDFLGDTPYTMKDADFYLAQIKRKTGDPQGAHEYFLKYLKKMGDPDFQIFYAYWVPKIGNDQAQLYDKIESQWARVRQ